MMSRGGTYVAIAPFFKDGELERLVAGRLACSKAALRIGEIRHRQRGGRRILRVRNSCVMVQVHHEDASMENSASAGLTGIVLPFESTEEVPVHELVSGSEGRREFGGDEVHGVADARLAVVRTDIVVERERSSWCDVRVWGRGRDGTL